MSNKEYIESCGYHITIRKHSLDIYKNYPVGEHAHFEHSLQLDRVGDVDDSFKEAAKQIKTVHDSFSYQGGVLVVHCPCD